MDQTVGSCYPTDSETTGAVWSRDKDKTMADELMYVLNDDTQNYPLILNIR